MIFLVCTHTASRIPAQSATGPGMTFSGILVYLLNEFGGRFGLPIQSMPRRRKGVRTLRDRVFCPGWSGGGGKGKIFSERGLPRGKNCAKIIKPFRGAPRKKIEYPGVAQLVARLTGGQEAVSSSLATRTRRGAAYVAPLFLFDAEQNSRPPF